MKFKVATGGGAAWRALYLYAITSKSVDRHWGTQVCRIVLDPNDGVKPNLSIGVGRKTFRLQIPRLSFKHPATPLRRKLYSLQSSFWCGVDGRYGWFTSARKRANAA